MNEKILVVDDEQNILELLEYNLKKEGFEVLRADTGEKAAMLLERTKPDLILLDRMLPGIDGLDLLRKIRGADRFSDIPVIMVTARADEIDKIIGLELGADDYVTKPFSVRELVARVKANLRKAGRPDKAPGIEDYEDLKVDTANYKAYVGGTELKLTLKEFELLSLLLENRNKLLNRDTILNRIWGYDYLGETRTVDVHITNLRKKMGKYADNIETVRGVGYRFKE